MIMSTPPLATAHLSEDYAHFFFSVCRLDADRVYEDMIVSFRSNFHPVTALDQENYTFRSFTINNTNLQNGVLNVCRPRNSRLSIVIPGRRASFVNLRRRWRLRVLRGNLCKQLPKSSKSTENASLPSPPG